MSRYRKDDVSATMMRKLAATDAFLPRIFVFVSSYARESLKVRQILGDCIN